MKVTRSPEIDAVAWEVTTEKPSPPAAPATTCVPSEVGMTPLAPCLKATITVARPLRPGMVTVPLCLIPGLAKTRDTECYAAGNVTQPAK